MASGKRSRGFFMPSSFKDQWAFFLWIMIFASVLFVGMFGTSKNLPLQADPNYFWHSWEIAALGSTILFNLLFYVLGFFMPPRMFLQLRVKEYTGLFPLLMALTVGLLAWSTYISLHDGDCTLQIALLLAASVLLLVFDFVMGRQSRSEKVRQDFQTSVRLNDIPICIAFFVLWLFSCVHPFEGVPPNDRSFRAFIGGAIAFQMLLSNWVVALIFRKPGEWSLEYSRESDEASRKQVTLS